LDPENRRRMTYIGMTVVIVIAVVVIFLVAGGPRLLR
jgi:uncharacterized Rmd1/YagE family protein